MNSKKEWISRIGIASKGVVYILMGTLTALAAFGVGGKTTGGKGTLQFIADKTYGKILLISIGIGLLSYLFYRFYLAFANPKDHEANTKGYVMRISYVVSGMAYGLLAYTAFRLASGSSESGSDTTQKLLNSDYGHIVAIVVAICLLGKSIYEFYMGYSGKFKEEVEHSTIQGKAKTFLINAGTVGFTARGVVVGILSYLFFKTGLSDSNESFDRNDVFSFLENEFGTLIMAVVAIGVALYGVFMLLKAKYPNLNLS